MHLERVEPYLTSTMNMYTLMHTVEEDFLLRLLIYIDNKSRSGAPGRTRTCNPRLRRPVLYPVELRARGSQFYTNCTKALAGTAPDPALSARTARLNRRNAAKRNTGNLVEKGFVSR